MGRRCVATRRWSAALAFLRASAATELEGSAPAIGATGLQLYSFGQTVSIPYFDGSWRPDSFVDRILSNRAAGLHTLCLLDIKVKEPDYEALARGARNAPTRRALYL